MKKQTYEKTAGIQTGKEKIIINKIMSAKNLFILIKNVKIQTSKLTFHGVILANAGIQSTF